MAVVSAIPVNVIGVGTAIGDEVLEARLAWMFCGTL